MLLNLVGNAVKFTECGRVRIASWFAAGMVFIPVEDTGIDFKPKILPLIFDEFRQTDAGATRKYGGG